jgi:cbb3-type cytochrome oxidase maturation protein
MNEATIAQTIMTLLILVIFLGFLIWGIKSRQFHNVEDAKYRMLDDGNDVEKEKGQDNLQEKQS